MFHASCGPVLSLSARFTQAAKLNRWLFGKTQMFFESICRKQMSLKNRLALWTRKASLKFLPTVNISAINLSLIVHVLLCIHKYKCGLEQSSNYLKLVAVTSLHFLFPGLSLLAFRRYSFCMDVGAHQIRMMLYHSKTKARLRSVQTITNSLLWVR